MSYSRPLGFGFRKKSIISVGAIVVLKVIDSIPFLAAYKAPHLQPAWNVKNLWSGVNYNIVETSGLVSKRNKRSRRKQGNLCSRVVITDGFKWSSAENKITQSAELYD